MNINFLKNRTVLGAVCIALSLVICFGVAPLLNAGSSKTVKVVRVTSDIKSGDAITKSMVQSVDVGSLNLPESIIKDSGSVVGKYATKDMVKGDYVFTTKVSDSPYIENTYLSSLDGKKQAISVTIKTFANGLSGKIKSGDIVSIISPDYKKTGQTIIPKSLQYVEVIAVTSNTGVDTENQQIVSDKEKELPATVTLLVSSEQAKTLAELDADGKLHLTLVYRGTRENADKFLEAQNKVNSEVQNSESN